MKLIEFAEIMKYLPGDTEVEIVTKNQKQMKPAMMIEEWGNHDGRFNLKCRSCGYRTSDIPRDQKAAMVNAVKTMACPRCGTVTMT